MKRWTALVIFNGILAYIVLALIIFNFIHPDPYAMTHYVVFSFVQALMILVVIVSVFVVWEYFK